MPDEMSKRRPEFVEGVSFKLADGNLWHMAEPRLESFPKFVDGKVHLGLATHFGPAFDALVSDAGDAETFSDQLAVAFGLAAFMLRANYDLADDELSGLLRFHVGDEASMDLYSSVIDVALGQSPKPTPVG